MLRRGLMVLAVLSCSSAFAGYIEDRAAAVKLKQERKTEEALVAFMKLGEADSVSPFQTSDALEQAAECARILKQFDLADELTGRIPLEPVAKSVAMRNLLYQGKAEELIRRFKDEKLETWPDYAAREAYVARGRAYHLIEDGEAAEHDLKNAAELFAARSLRSLDILYLLGNNRRDNLHDDDKALEAYGEALKQEHHSGNGSYLNNVLAAAEILRKQGQYDRAEATLQMTRGGVHNQQGDWRGILLAALGRIHADAGQTDAAVAAYREIIAYDKARPSQRKAAEEAIAELQGNAD